MKLRIAFLALAVLVSPVGGLYAQSEGQPSPRILPISVGGNTDKGALSPNLTRTRKNDSTIYRLTVKDVPVDGFWEITVYDSDGHIQKNGPNTRNSITSTKARDGSIMIQFGGCNRAIRNCLPTTPGWNYVVRLYQPRPEILDGSWTFPEAQAVR